MLKLYVKNMNTFIIIGQIQWITKVVCRVTVKTVEKPLEQLQISTFHHVEGWFSVHALC